MADTVKEQARIQGYGGLGIERHQVTLASGAGTVNTRMAQPKSAIAYFASGQTASTEGFRCTIAGQVITVTSSSGSSTKVVDVLVLGF